MDFNQDCASRIKPRSADRRQKADDTTVNIKQDSIVVLCHQQINSSKKRN